MANSKNTIQNIPLTGPLCLNKLKTDVTQFEGYNEKNTTVFGGELIPIHEKETELGYKDNTYSFFNSKGERFTIKNKNSLYDNNDNLIGNVSVPSVIEHNDVPDNAYWCASTTTDSFYSQLYLTTNGDLYGRIHPYLRELSNQPYVLLHSFNVNLSDKLVSAAAQGTYYVTGSQQLTVSFVVDVDSNNYKLYYYSLYDIVLYSFPLSIDYSKKVVGSELLPKTVFTSSLFTSVVHTQERNKVIVQVVPFSGQREVDNNAYVKMIILESVQNAAPTVETLNKPFFIDSMYSVIDADLVDEWGIYINYIKSPGAVAAATIDLTDYTLKTVEVCPLGSYLVFQHNTNTDVTLLMCAEIPYFTGHDSNYFIPGIKTELSINYSEYYINGLLYARGIKGRLVCSPGLIKAPFYHVDYNSITYKDEDEKWYTFTSADYSFTNYRKTSMMVLDNRYVPLNDEKMYDIENKTIIKAPLDYIDTTIPVKWAYNRSLPTSFKGMVYASGYNVNYPITKNPFTSLLLNPKEIKGVPVDFFGFLPINNNDSTTVRPKYQDIDIFYSIGDEVQSAVYQGKNPEYFDTTYPIDINGNTVYPITWNSQIIKGYSNNDLIKEEDTAYPLIYWNNNQKMYTYYQLSSMEDITGAFALQGQQYTLDDNNIYNVQFNNGVIQSVNTVCYKKNMQFLGTLPTSAVFYSKYNKTFYQFTGDNILTKMFEANDINEIKMVGQNPSTLSLWICTDNGVYVLSDTDMFKLEYDAKDIYFNDEKTIIVTESETNWIENDISLYDIGNEATETPIKLATKYYGLGGELKANYDCWYIRLHSADKKAGKLKVKVNTITNTSFETEEKVYEITKNMYDANDTLYIRYQPKYQTAVATQLELESDIAIYQISLGVNATDAVAQQSKFNF